MSHRWPGARSPPGLPDLARTSSGRSLNATKPAARTSSTRLTLLSRPGYPRPPPLPPGPRVGLEDVHVLLLPLGLQVGIEDEPLPPLLPLLLPSPHPGVYFACG